MTVLIHVIGGRSNANESLEKPLRSFCRSTRSTTVYRDGSGASLHFSISSEHFSITVQSRGPALLQQRENLCSSRNHHRFGNPHIQLHYYRFLIANTSPAGVLSPVQLIRLGASKKLNVNPSF